MFEEVREGRVHNGIDLSMPEGTELRSVANGVVERITNYGNENIGTGVIIRTDDGTRFIYGHLSEASVNVGDQITTGQLIGLSGNTGHSTGAHLHFAVHQDGQFVNPMSYRDSLDALSGDVVAGVHNLGSSLITNPVQAGLDKLTGKLYENMEEKMVELIYDFLSAVAQVLVELSYSVTLIGGAILILFYVMGANDAKKWFSIIFMTNLLITFLLG